MTFSFNRLCQSVVDIYRCGLLSFFHRSADQKDFPLLLLPFLENNADRFDLEREREKERKKERRTDQLLSLNRTLVYSHPTRCI